VVPVERGLALSAGRPSRTFQKGAPPTGPRWSGNTHPTYHFSEQLYGTVPKHLYQATQIGSLVAYRTLTVNKCESRGTGNAAAHPGSPPISRYSPPRRPEFPSARCPPTLSAPPDGPERISGKTETVISSYRYKLSIVGVYTAFH
jgi:hypothetical protein